MAKKQSRGSKKNINTKNSNKEQVIKDYRNPAETLWGKITIWILLSAMVLGVVLGLIFAIIEFANK